MPQVYPTGRNWQPNPLANLVPLFINAAWVKHANAQASPDGLTLTLSATGPWQATRIDVPVAPNTQYNFSGVVTTVAGSGFLACSLSWTKDGVTTYRNISDSPITVPVGVASVKITCEASDAGTFTFSNLTLRRVQPSLVGKFVTYFNNLIPLFTDARWFKDGTATVSPNGKTLTLVTTGSVDNFGVFAVSPLATYKFEADISTTATATVDLRWGRTTQNGAHTNFRSSGAYSEGGTGHVSLMITTSATENFIEVWLTAVGAGTFSFSNLSFTKV